MSSGEIKSTIKYAGRLLRLDAKERRVYREMLRSRASYCTASTVDNSWMLHPTTPGGHIRLAVIGD